MIEQIIAKAEGGEGVDLTPFPRTHFEALVKELQSQGWNTKTDCTIRISIFVKDGAMLIGKMSYIIMVQGCLAGVIKKVSAFPSIRRQRFIRDQKTGIFKR